MKAWTAAAFMLVLALSGTGNAMVPEAANVGDGTECLICQFLVKELDKYLTSPSTVSTIVGYIEDVCHLLPDKDQTACKGFVDEYGKDIVDWIAQKLNTQDICNDILHLGCSGAAIEKAMRLAIKDTIEEKFGSSCTICKDLVGALQQALEDPQTDKDIVKEVDKVCDGLGALKNLCVDLVNDWAPDVIHWLAKELDPSTVCNDIHVCTVADPAPKQVNLLGGKRCTWGPSYWCQSEDHARACGALQHCRERVWTKEQ